MSQLNGELPRWDVSVIYPGLDSMECQAGMEQLGRDIDKLVERFDQLGIEGGESLEIDYSIIADFEFVLQQLGNLIETSGTIRSYIFSFVTTDSRNELAQSRYSAFQKKAQQLSILTTRFTAWVGAMDVDALIARSALAAEHAFILKRAVTKAQHLMSSIEEELSSELTLSGASAWARLHGTYSSQLTAQLPAHISLEINPETEENRDGEMQELAISAVRNLAYHPDRNVREQAYQSELEVWERASVPLAACLNGVKGETISLAKRRGWSSVLEQSLFDNGIDQEILDSMMEAVYESFPDFRRYLKAKARRLGMDQLTWYDLFAPITQNGRQWTYAESTELILEQFNAYSPRLGQLAQRAFDEQWIDAEPRPGKRDGAFCMRLRGEESRILANFKPNYAGLNTLAHELGHAYHGYVLAERTPFQKQYPMTLAETASIFCETIVRQAAINRVDQDEQINILESALMSACQVVVDICSRFLFEQKVCTLREQRELSISELNDEMLNSQRQAYGDGLDDCFLHPYAWSVKPHYYIATRPYYNYPYTFGLLFGLGLYARYQDDPNRFRANYDDLLSSTGLASATDLADRFQIDIRSPQFWRSSLDVVRDNITQFEMLSA